MSNLGFWKILLCFGVLGKKKSELYIRRETVVMLLKSQLSSIVFLAIFSLLFLRMISNAHEFFIDESRNYPAKYIYADHTAFKVYPKVDQQKRLLLNRRAYEFINEKDWIKSEKIVPKVESVEEAVLLKKKEMEVDKPGIGEKLNYKNHDVQIVKNPKKEVKEVMVKNRVQLGAFQSLNKAEQEWARINNAFPKVLKGHNFTIEKGYLKKQGMVYRLQIGPFSGVNEARGFCNMLRKKQISCFITIS
jgi:hypothetical protein